MTLKPIIISGLCTKRNLIHLKKGVKGKEIIWLEGKLARNEVYNGKNGFIKATTDG
jgi:hypothetical protein